MKNTSVKIDTAEIVGIPGRIGLTSCPGLSEECCGSTLEADLQEIRGWGANLVLTLLDDLELRTSGVADLGKKVVALDMIWLQLPIPNMGLPDDEFMEKWQGVVPWFCKMLRNGQNIVVHCRGGVGRTGLMAACLLIELGLTAREAIGTVRNARPGSLLHAPHENYCYSYVPSLRQGGGNAID